MCQLCDSNEPSPQTNRHILNVQRNAITMCPVGKMVNIFKICVPKMFKCTHRPRTGIIYNGPCHVTLMYPNKRSGYIQCRASISLACTAPRSHQHVLFPSSLSPSMVPTSPALSRTSRVPCIVTYVARFPIAQSCRAFRVFHALPSVSWCLVPDLPRRFPWLHHMLSN